ncbi:MAG: sulfotransferase [Balneolaceae bacterium]|nr:sulfotransferase [Balneolaceae bacterium]
MSTRNHPIYNLTSQLRKHQAFTRENISRIGLYYLKLLLQEPFRILEEVNCSRKIARHRPAQDPVFIIGHWRSGTSFLQYLMSQDPRFGYMNKFQVVFPDLFLTGERVLKPLIRRIPEGLKLVNDAQNMSINLDLDSPSEIEIGLTTMISPSSLHWGHIFPTRAREYFDKFIFFDHLSEEEKERWSQDYRHLIRKTSLKNNGRQLLIKSPGNAARMSQLLDLYPDARFIFIHRNPYDVFYSNKKMWKTLLDNLALEPFSETEMEEEIIYLYARLMRTYLEQRSAVPWGQLTEIRFDRFVDHPVRQLESAYNHLQIDRFDEVKPHFERFLDTQTRGKTSSYEYDPEILERLHSEWSFVFDVWDYDREAPAEKVPA